MEKSLGETPRNKHEFMGEKVRMGTTAQLASPTLSNRLGSPGLSPATMKFELNEEDLEQP